VQMLASENSGDNAGARTANSVISGAAGGIMRGGDIVVDLTKPTPDSRERDDQ
jgi:hypothetical protein